MADNDDYVKPPRAMTQYEQDCVADLIREFMQLVAHRNQFATHWEEVSELILPTSRNTFMYGNYNWPGQKKTDRQIDSTGALALVRFAAICQSLLTPRDMVWHSLAADDDYVMKDRATKLWFEQVTKLLFRERYKALANFVGQNHASFVQLGAFGTQGMFVDAVDVPNMPQIRGLRYKSIPVGELFIKENHQGLVDAMYRWFKMTARQAYQKWPDTFPEKLQPALKSGSENLYNFLHCVKPRTDYDPDMRAGSRGMPFGSYYVCLESNTLLSEGGYRMFPAAISRYEQTPWETYGRSPAMMVLPALKTLNAQKRTFLKAGHRAADPVLLTADDGLIDMSMRPGAVNKGGVSADGRPLVHPLPVGNIQVTETMMAEEKSLIQDAFLVNLFQILTETPTMTATEVIERVNEKGILLAPTVGRQGSEYTGPLVEREMDVLASQGFLPPMPPRLREAKGAYRVVDQSPLAKAQRAQEAAGFLRTVETVKELVAVTQDPSLLDRFDFDTAVPAIADIQSVPESWMADDDAVARKRQNRAQQQAVQQKIQAMPAEAALMKAQAVQAKAGVGQQPALPGQAPAQGGPPLQQQIQGG